MIKLTTMQETYGFTPANTFDRYRRRVSEGCSDIYKVEDTGLFSLIRTLTDKAFPTADASNGKEWDSFYVPVRRRDAVIVMPMTVHWDSGKYLLTFPDKAPIEVSEGAQSHPLLQSLLRDALGFADIVKCHPDVIEHCLPHDFRTGRVRGWDVLDPLLPNGLKHQIKRDYADHLAMNLTCDRLSLNEYLHFAALCYEAAFQWQTDGLTPEQMYRTWADGRDCGMLDIPDRTSPELFRSWVEDHEDCGGHPFEIVRSRDGLGIHLIPFRFDDSCLTLLVSSDSQAWLYLDMVQGLLRAKAPFHAPRDLDRILEYLSGEEYFMVNKAGRHSIQCNWQNRRLWRAVQWDPLKMLNWR